MTGAARPRLSVVVPTFDTCEMTLRCCAAAWAALPAGGELIVVDDGSGDETATRVRAALPGAVVVRREHNGGYSAAVNTGLAHARGDVVLLLNSDAHLDAAAAEALLAAFDHDPAVGVAGAQLLDADGTPQWSGGREPGLAWMMAVVSGLGPVVGAWRQRVRALRHATAQGDRDVHWVSGAAMAVRRAALEATGRFDERVCGYGQDLDFCVRARAAGWRVRIVATARVPHLTGATLAPRSPLRHDPARLWPDLLDWGARRHGPAWGNVARPLLRALAWGRVLARALTGRPRTDPVSAALARGARALAGPRPPGAPGQVATPGDVEVVRASARAVPYLAARQAGAQALNLASGILLARWLTPAEFGLFAIVIFGHAVVTAAVGPALATALLRDPEEPAVEPQRAAFTLALAAAIAVAMIAWAAAPAFVAIDGAGAEGAFAVRALGGVALLAAWQVVPASLMERRLDYRSIALVELAQAMMFHGLLIALVFSGYRLGGLAVALLARALAGAGLAAWRCAWQPGLQWRGEAAARVRGAGMPFQGATAVNLAKDAATPVLVGMLAGPVAVGQVAWAQMVAGFPSLAVAVLQRILLPAFARLGERREALGRAVESAIAVLHLAAAPVAMLTLVTVDSLVTHVFGGQWRPAIPLFVLLWLANLVAPTTTAALALLGAVGRPRQVLAASLGWAGGTWALAVPLVWAWGAIGYGVANVAVQGVSAWVIAVARRHVRFAWARAMAPAWLLAAVAAATVLLGQHWVPVRGPGALVTWLAAGLVVYGGLVAAVGLRRLAPVIAGRGTP